MTRNQLELLERYLEKRMSEAEMAGFENALLHDPLLKNELELQRDIIESIRQYRKAEIKARLDQIQINPVSYYSTFFKIAASVTVASFLSWGTYTMISGDKEPIVKVDLPSFAEKVETQIIPDIPVAINIDPIYVPVDEVVSSSAPRINKAVAKKEIKIPEVRLPDIMGNFEDTSPFINDEGALRTNGNPSVMDESSTTPEILIKKIGKRNRFFYQNYDGKLYLYGDFSASPYELIELNIDNGRRLFLMYDSSYFAILPDQKEMTPLENIKDSAIIKELDVLKDSKK